MTTTAPVQWKLPGERGYVPVQARSERFASFRHADFPSVTGREAEWKYTPVKELGDLIDGPLEARRYDVEDPRVPGIGLDWIGRDDPRIGTVGKPEDRAAANAWESFHEALLITVRAEDGEQAVIRRSGFGSTPMAAHTFIEVRPNANALVILGGRGDARLVENLEVHVGEDANLTLIVLGEWDDSAVQLGSHFAKVDRRGHLKHMVFSLGGRIVRLNPSVRLDAPFSSTDMFGLYFADAHQHLESQVWVHHVGPDTRSRVNYKGGLQGEGAHTVWIGDVLIGRDADRTDSYEQNRNLVLTRGTRADSVPNLEIETGDIEGAGHASATGRFDDEQLFYLMTRGMDEATARRLVVHGFLHEIVQEVGNPVVEAELGELLERELARGDAEAGKR